MRKVTASIWDTTTKSHRVVTGLFHMWGCEYEEFAEGPGNATMAIIELPDGQIVTALPHNVKFEVLP